jgi:hypothetical protein
MALKRKEELFDEFKTEIEELVKSEKEVFINKVKIEAAKGEIFVSILSQILIYFNRNEPRHDKTNIMGFRAV